MTLPSALQRLTDALPANPEHDGPVTVDSRDLRAVLGMARHWEAANQTRLTCGLCGWEARGPDAAPLVASLRAHIAIAHQDEKQEST